MVKTKSLACKVNAKSASRPRLSMDAVAMCSNRESLESEFKKHRMSKKQSMDFLMKAMRISAVSYSKGYPSIEERYKAIMETYLSGVWKRNYSSWEQEHHKCLRF